MPTSRIMQQEKYLGIQHVGDIDSQPPSEADETRLSRSQMKRNARDILLVPQPSDDPRDPLVGLKPQSQNRIVSNLYQNWSAFKKVTTLAVICLAAWSVLLQALANASGEATKFCACSRVTESKLGYRICLGTSEDANYKRTGSGGSRIIRDPRYGRRFPFCTRIGNRSRTP